MSELKSPVQPFIVRHKGALSALQMQSLIQLYQPIIGLDAVNLYLLLFQQPVNEKKISTEKVHSSLFAYIAGSLGKIDDARLRLEAVGLIETYKQTAEGILYPTLLYDMQYPLLVKDFLNQPLLSNALMSQLGEVEFINLIRQWEMAPIEIAEYEEVSVSFETVFSLPKNDYQAQIQQAASNYALQGYETHSLEQQALESFDYARLMRKLVQHKINHQILGPRVKQEVLAIHTIYGLNEEQLFDLLMSCYDAKAVKIDFMKLKRLANKTSETPLKESATQSSATPINENVKQTPMTIEMAKAAYPNFNQQELNLLLLCEKIPPQAMLAQIKKDKQGFVSSNEMEYIQNIAQRSNLSIAMQSYLVYYVLVILNRPQFQKGESERIANQWQQAKLTTVGAAMTYVQQALKAKAIKNQQQANRQTSNYAKKPQKVEVQPAWFNQTATNVPTTHNVVTSKSEQEIREQLNRLLNTEEK